MKILHQRKQFELQQTLKICVYRNCTKLKYVRIIKVVVQTTQHIQFIQPYHITFVYVG